MPVRLPTALLSGAFIGAEFGAVKLSLYRGGLYAKPITKIDLADARMLYHLIWRALHQHGAITNDSLIDDIECFADIMVGDRKTPIPWFFKCPIRSRISPSAIGSTPASGSSSNKNVGRAASARAIPSRRRSPPDKIDRWRVAQMGDAKFSHQFIKCGVSFIIVVIKRFQYGADILFDSQALKMLDSCGRYPMPSRARWKIGRAVTSCPSIKTLPSSAGINPANI